MTVATLEEEAGHEPRQLRLASILDYPRGGTVICYVKT